MSLIVTCFNKEEYIKECLDSLKRQSYSQIEIIIVDDASTDASYQQIDSWIQKFGPDLIHPPQVIRMPHNVGFAGAVTVGLFAGKGEFIAFQDADDLSHPDRIKKQVNYLQVHSEYGLVGCNYMTLGGGSDSNSDWLRYGEDIISCYQQGGHCICLSSALIRGACFDQLGGLSRAVDGSEDSDFVRKMIDHQIKLDNISDTLYYVRECPLRRSKHYLSKSLERICFVILAHENEQVLKNQVDNIRKYNPQSKVVLYNGGKDPEFGKGIDIDICPYSRPVQVPNLGRVFYDVMKWLEESDIDYEFLINVDSDIMFVNPGFETFLQECMKDYHFMGLWMRKIEVECNDPWWWPAYTLWHEGWEKWNPFFQTNDYIIGTLNAMQVYRREIIQKMLNRIDIEKLEELVAKTEVYAIEEMLYGTLAARNGGKWRRYPTYFQEYIRLGDPFTLNEIKKAKEDPSVFFVHPIARHIEDLARKWITINP